MSLPANPLWRGGSRLLPQGCGLVFDSIGKGRGKCGLGLERPRGDASPEGGERGSGEAEEGIGALPQGGVKYITKSLILAQNERWRRVLSMQVEREPAPQGAGESGERVSNT